MFPLLSTLRRTVSAARHLSSARRRRTAPSLARAALSVIESLEDRQMFGFDPPSGGSIPAPGTECVDCPCPELSEPDSNSGADSPDPESPGQVSTAPVRALTGAPIITSNDLSSSAFGKTWSWTRSWSGLNETSQNGNGWSVSTLPYIAIRANDYPTQHTGIIMLIQGGQANRQYILPDDTDDNAVSRYSNQGSITYVAPTTVGMNKVPGEYHLTDAMGNLLVFYDLPHTAYDDSDGGTFTPVEQHGRLYTNGTYPQQKTNQWFNASTGVSYNGGSGTAAAYRYGALKSWTDASGRLTITADYDADANLTALTRTDGSGAYERFAITYSTITNGLAASAKLITNVALQQATSDAGPWTTIKDATSTYYSGTVGDDTDKHGRFGDLKTVVTKDYQRDPGGEVVNNVYYRYVKEYGLDDPATYYYGYSGRGPTNDFATTGGTDTDFTPDMADDVVMSGLKTVVEGANFARLAANRGSVASFQDDADADINPYANNVFTYQRTDENYNTSAYYANYYAGTFYQVIEETAAAEGCSTCSGGFGTFKYEYFVGTKSTETVPAGGVYLHPNIWCMRFTEYLPDTTSGDWTDNDKRIVYTNDLGKVLLSVLIDKHGTSSATDDQQFITACNYDGNYRLLNVAHPSAVLGYCETYGDLVNWANNYGSFLAPVGGLYDRYDYGYSTTADDTTPGDVEGYLKGKYVRSGWQATEVQVWAREYYEHADGGSGMLLHPVATKTSFWDIDRDNDDDPVTATFEYAWWMDGGNIYETNRVKSVTVTAPTVDAGRNGPGSAPTSIAYFDVVGRPIWTMDEDGFINYTAYDNASGGIIKQIVDVDTTQTGTFANKPSGWTTPGGAGLHLTTTFDVDDSGRATKITDPNGNETYNVYIDVNREVRTYHSAPGGFSQVGPVEISRTYWPVQSASSGQRTVYNESITSSATPVLDSGVPDGTETIDSTNILSLNRSITNDAGQVIKQDAYFNLSGVSYVSTTPAIGVSGMNYNETLTDYDARNRLKRTETPNGTITRFLYDVRGNPTQTWIGTDDTPSSGFWSPGNTGGTNLTLVSENLYDSHERGGQAAPAMPMGNDLVTGSGSVAPMTYYVLVTYVTTSGETVASPEATITIGTNTYLTVESPATVGDAVSYNVYFSDTSGQETLQTPTPITLGTDWIAFVPNQVADMPTPPQRFIGDGNLTATIGHPTGSTSATADRVTLFYQDWRNRTVAQKAGARLNGDNFNDIANEANDTQRPITYQTLDNAGHATATFVYDGDGEAITWTGGVPDQPDSALRRGKSEMKYDDWGRVYQTLTYSVDPSDGSISSDTLTTNVFRDKRGNVIETIEPGGLISKQVIDGAGRTIKTYVTDGGGDSDWTDADDVSGDKVLEQTAYTYDANSNAVLTVTKQRFHDETGTGELGSPTSTPYARIYYAGAYYDVLNRATDTVDYGANAAQAIATRPAVSAGRTDLTGTADSGSTTTLLDSPLSSTSGSYVGYTVRITGGTGSGQSATVIAYNGSTKTLTLAPTLGVALNNTSVYVLEATPHVSSVAYAADEVQTVTITGSPSGGTFTLTFGANTTSSLAYNASAATVQSALQGLGSIGANNALVAGPAGGPYIVRFAGSKAGSNVGAITASASLTGGSTPGVAISTTSQGGDNGMPQTSTDPRGNVGKTDYNMLGQTVRSIAGFTDFVPSDTDDQTTVWTYDGSGNMTAMTAVMPSGTNSQTTGYIFGITTGGGSSINSNDVLLETRYPDKSTGAAGTSSSDKEQFRYNAVGDITKLTDQNGNVHDYLYDTLGRSTADKVTTVGSGVDGTVQRLETAYNTQFLPYLSTSYDDDTGGTVINEVRRDYNGLGQVTVEYQNHSAAVNTSTSPKVQYTYTEMAGSANHSRLKTMVYPNGRILRYEYSSGLDNNISRLMFLADDSSGSVGTHLEEYSYLGLDTIVRAARPEPGTELTYIKQGMEANADAGDKYIGLDRFGLIADQRWIVTSGATALDRFQYGYDKNSNPLYKLNTVQNSASELYHANSTASGDNNSGYDKANRLTEFRRGTLTSSGNNGSGLDTVSGGNLSGLTGSSRTWTLDAVGNQSSTNTGGTPTSRTHNSRNQVTVVGGNNLAFDNNGNTTTDENGKKHQYDAWNRRTGFDADADNDVTSNDDATYRYDGIGRRLNQTIVGGTATDYFYTANWQVIEDRQSGNAVSQYVWGITYVNDLVLRDRNADSNSGTGNLGKSSSGLEERLYAQHDANHNVTSLTNTSATVQQRFVYDPYGSVTVLAGNWSGTSDAYDWSYRFQGGRLETATSTYIFQRRDYDPVLGRWLEGDPLGYVDGPNQYQGFGSSPISNLDPLGLAENSVYEWQQFLELDRRVRGNDINRLFQSAAAEQIRLDPPTDTICDCRSDMRNILVAMYKSYARIEGTEGIEHPKIPTTKWNTPGGFLDDWGAGHVNDSMLRHFFGGTKYGSIAQDWFEWKTGGDANLSDHRQDNAAAYLGDKFDSWVGALKGGECPALMRFLAGGHIKFTDIFGDQATWDSIRNGTIEEHKATNDLMDKLAAKAGLPTMKQQLGGSSHYEGFGT